MKLQRYLDRHCNESLRFLKIRQQELQDWKDAGLPESQDPATNVAHHTIAKSFSTWFGYPYNPALTFYTAHNNNKLDAAGDKELLTLPAITTLADAVDRVLGIIERSINAFEK